MNYSVTPTDRCDFAVIGAGLSGLMLTRALLENKATAGARILLVDKSFTDYPPRTWCFWEKGEGMYEGLVEQRWSAAEFFQGSRQLTINLEPYQYKMICGLRFRQETMEWIKRHPNVTLQQTSVESLHPMRDFVWVNTAKENFKASMVFDSRYDWQALEKHRGLVLYQQFAGWFVQSETPVFDAQVARLMDFRMEQKEAVAFCYVLPTDAHNALVEYTLFTPRLQPQEKLERSISEYLATRYKGAWMDIKSREKGVIPMTDLLPRQQHPSIIPIGMAGGCTKPSSGYTFLFAQQHTDAIIAALNRGAVPEPFVSPGRFRFFDRVFLRVLRGHPDKGAKILFDLFRQNLPEKVLDFMGNSSDLREEARIFAKMPWGVFVPAAVWELKY